MKFAGTDPGKFVDAYNKPTACAVPAKDRPAASEAELKAKDAALSVLAEEKAYPPTAKQSPEGAATRGAADERIAELEPQCKIKWSDFGFKWPDKTLRVEY